MNLKERIAALQQRAASTSPQASTSLSASQSSLHTLASSPSLTTAGSGAGLRDRIAKFEEKGGVPVPRGSFGLGAAPSREATPYKRGELYGNRISSVSRPSGSQSPPSKQSRLGVGLAPLGDGRRSVSSSELDDADMRPARRRCLSSPMLQSFEQPNSAGAGSLNFPDETSGPVEDETSLEVAQDTMTGALAALDEPQTPPPNRLKRSSTISGADAMRMSETMDDPPPPLPSFPSPSPATDSPSLSLSLRAETVEPSELQDSASAHGAAPEVRTSPLADALHDPSDSGFLGTHTATARQDAVIDPESEAQEVLDEDVRDQELSVEVDDDDLSKTPVVATFAAPSAPLSCSIEEPPVSQVLETLTVERDSSPIPSPTTADSDLSFAKLEIGERAYAEQTKYVVIPPSLSVVTVTSEKTPTVEGKEAELPHASAGRSSSQERLVDEPPSASTFTEANREVTSPVACVPQEKYVEPILEQKTGPRSFHVVVHGKKQWSKVDPLQSASQPPKSPAQVVVVHQSLTERFGPETSASADLSDLLSQALTLEQQLLGGDENNRKLKPASLSKLDVTSNPSASQSSAIAFPHSDTSDKYLPSPPLPTPPPGVAVKTASMKNRTSTRTESSWSSSHTSSEDSVSVITPPSPTFDLITPPLYADMKFGDSDLGKLQIKMPDGVVNVEKDEEEGRRSFGSVLSSPGRSARKKLLSMSRTLGRSSRSSTTLHSNGMFCSIHIFVLLSPARVATDADSHDTDSAPRPCFR